MNEKFPVSNKQLCKDWGKEYIISNILLLFISLIISIANLLLSFILSKLTTYEKSHSITGELASGTLKIFIALFINSVFTYITLGNNNFPYKI